MGLPFKTRGAVLHPAMPKQDKGGGIFPTAEGARIVLTSSKQRGGKAPPHRLPSLFSSLSKRGKPAIACRLFLVYSILILK